MWVVDCRVRNTTADGIAFYGASDCRALYNIIEDNTIAGVERYGINLERAARVESLVLRGNSVFAPGASTMELEGKVFDSIITGNLSTAADLPKGFSALHEASPFVDIYETFRNEKHLDSSASIPSSDTIPATQAAAPHGATVNVRDFGAMGDGVTDDRLAFVRAIAQLPKTGGVLRIPSGSYRIGTGNPEEHKLPFTAVRQHLLIQNCAMLSIIGDGPSSELVFTDPDMQGLKIVSSNGLRIADMRFRLERQPSLRHNRALLDIAALRNIVVDKVRISQSSGPGIYIDCCTGIAIRDSTIIDAGQYGIRLSGVVDAEVSGNTIINARDHGILVNHFGGILREPRNIHISNNTVKGSHDA